MRQLLYVAVFFISLIAASCGTNRSDQDIINEITYNMNNGEYQTALALFDELSVMNEDLFVLKAEATAGLSGFRFLSIMDNLLKEETLSPLEIVFNLSNSSSDEKINEIKIAAKIIEDNLDQRARSGKTDLKYSFFEFYKGSLILRRFFQDKLIDWNPCDETQLPSSAIRELIVAINKGVESITLAIEKEKLTKLNRIANTLREITFLTKTNTYKFVESKVTTQEISIFRSAIRSNIVTKGVICQ